jgi:hypothetical protein
MAVIMVIINTFPAKNDNFRFAVPTLACQKRQFSFFTFKPECCFSASYLPSRKFWETSDDANIVIS